MLGGGVREPTELRVVVPPTAGSASRGSLVGGPPAQVVVVLRGLGIALPRVRQPLQGAGHATCADLVLLVVVVSLH